MWEYQPGRPLVFNHVPKTAGTAVQQALIAKLHNNHIFEGMDRSTFASFDRFDRISRTARAAMVFEPGDVPADARMVCGHIAPSVTLARFPEGTHFTVLREPRLRILSMWMFSRAHTDLMLRRWSTYAVWFRAARGSLAEYLADPFVAGHSDNAIIRFLLWKHPLISADRFIDPRHDDELLEATLALLDDFGHVGVVEDPAWVSRLGRWLGTELSLRQLNGVRPLAGAVRPDFATELNSTTYSLLEDRSRIDMRLWRHFLARATPGVDLDQVSDDTLARGVGRYEAMQPASGGGLTRQALERAYAMKTRLTPSQRRHAHPVIPAPAVCERRF